MNIDTFVHTYLRFSEDELNRDYTIPLPEIAGLEKQSEFIVQGRRETTFSTNIITTYFSNELGLRVVEVYKNSQEEVKGIFMRLVGTMVLLRKGYPFLFLDAAVSNVSPLTAQKEDLSTRVAIHMPQANSVQRSNLFDNLSKKAADEGYRFTTREIAALPDFWGPIWSAQAAGLEPDFIGTLRRYAYESYELYCREASASHDFDYVPTQHQMVMKNSVSEYHLFQKMGLAVPAEAQAAFFSVLSFAG